MNWISYIAGLFGNFFLLSGLEDTGVHDDIVLGVFLIVLAFLSLLFHSFHTDDGK